MRQRITITDNMPPKLEREALERAIQHAQDYLLRQQHEKGYWAGALEADASVTAGYIPLMYFMGTEVDPARLRKIVNSLTIKQGTDGLWSAYHGGPGDLSVSVQVYFALKLSGMSADDPLLARARKAIVALGGIEGASVFAKLWLALFGQYEWSKLPALPPELIWLPGWFPISIYDFASWSRETIVALMLVLGRKPVCRVPENAGLAELYSSSLSKPARKRNSAWHTFFGVLDAVFKAWERLPSPPGRARAIKKAEKWLVAHQENDGSWGGILLPWVYALMGLKCLGHDLKEPAISRGLAGLEDFIIEDDQTLLLQPATSPVWDTAWTVLALAESGLPPHHPSLQSAARWLLDKEIRTPGDWRVKTRTEPGGWSFEFENRYYPDIDDAAVVPRALKHVALPAEEATKRDQAVERSVRWVLKMQGDNGGWAAFDRNNNKQILAHIPLADFMTPLDPTSPDVTAHVLELMGNEERYRDSVSKAIAYIKRQQESDGAWYGRWGVNYIYGSGLTLTGLEATGENMHDEYVGRAAGWLAAHQNSDGGWGESCRTYDDPQQRGQGSSTASQTAWALMGLLSAGGDREAIERGVAYLVARQNEDGSWNEDQFTGTGFPRSFYLHYDLYRAYFPLLALSRYRNRTDRSK